MFLLRNRFQQSDASPLQKRCLELCTDLPRHQCLQSNFNDFTMSSDISHQIFPKPNNLSNAIHINSLFYDTVSYVNICIYSSQLILLE